MDRFYDETFAVEGSELYTHVALRPADFRALEGLAAGASDPPAFTGWLLDAHREARVVLAGLFLGDGPARGALPVERLTPWLNPLASSPEEKAAHLGARANQVPLETLRGFIGLGPNYAALARWVRRLLRGQVRTRPPERVREDLPLVLDDGDLRRVLVIGDNEALPAFLREMSRRKRGLECVIATEIGATGRPFEQRIARFPRLSEESSGGCVVLSGENDTRTCVFGMEEISTRRLVRAPALEGPPFDAVVFLSDPTVPDPDARTSFRVLRFLRRIEDGSFPLGPRLHILAEIGAESTAEGIESHLATLQSKLGGEKPPQLRYTILSTNRIKNYFLAHGALIPGLITVHDELLDEEGPELLRVVVPPGQPWTGAQMSFEDILSALAPRRLLPLALELHGAGSLVVNPSPKLRFPASAVRSLYALGESKSLRTG